MSRQKTRFEIIEAIGVLGTAKNGWKTEVNVISYNGRQSVIDIREWSPDHTRMSHGLTLTERQANALAQMLNKKFENCW